MGPDNIIHYAAYETEPLDQAVAYAMILNYYSESLSTLTGMGIINSYGSFIENNIGGNNTVDAILQKLRNRQVAEQLGISFKLSGRGITYTMVVFKQSDGRYQFSYRGNW